MSASDPTTGPSWVAVDLVRVDTNEGTDTAELDLLDIGEGGTLGLSVSMHFSQCLSLSCLPIARTYQVFRLTKISQALHLIPTRFLDDYEGSQHTVHR